MNDPIPPSADFGLICLSTCLGHLSTMLKAYLAADVETYQEYKGKLLNDINDLPTLE